MALKGLNPELIQPHAPHAKIQIPQPLIIDVDHHEGVNRPRHPHERRFVRDPPVPLHHEHAEKVVEDEGAGAGVAVLLGQDGPAEVEGVVDPRGEDYADLAQELDSIALDFVGRFFDEVVVDGVEQFVDPKEVKRNGNPEIVDYPPAVKGHFHAG